MSSISEELKQKRDLYRVLASRFQNERGWFDFSCDGLLFNSIAGAAGFSGVKIHDSVIHDKMAPKLGRFIRRPEKMGLCNGDDPSRDMILGVMIWALTAKHVTLSSRKIALDRIWQTIKKNKKNVGFGYWYGKLGPGDNRTWFYPDMVCTLAICMERLGMGKFNEARWRDAWHWKKVESGGRWLYDSKLIKAYGGGFRSFERHLDVLHILCRAIATNGKLYDHEKKIFERHYNSHKENTFFLWAWARYASSSKAKHLKAVEFRLLDDKHFPSNALPTNKNHHTDYLWQRGPGRDWEPSKKKAQHFGVDFCFLVHLLQNF